MHSRMAMRCLAPILLAALVSLSMLAGCKASDTPGVAAPWPRAEKERSVPKPATPLIWPFTGKDAPSADAVLKRPLSVKIENSPAARPQTGLNSADVVYETIAEGGITRFNCIFHSDAPGTVGPVRSARLSDMWIVPQYNGLFVFSGASYRVNSAVRRAGLPNLSQDAGVSRPYSRSSARSAPHNLYLDTAEAYAEAVRREFKLTATQTPLQFAARPGPATASVNEVVIPFSQANTSQWTYDAETKRYLRRNNGRVHFDAASGEQVTADNVVVMWAKYSAQGRDKGGSTTYDVSLGGKGRVSVFHSGKRYDGTWTADRTTPPRFKDAAGRPIRLIEGRTWFQVIPLDGVITMK